MCGIAGIIGADSGIADLRRQLDLMQGALRHRGPDDAGSWFSPDGCAGFTHTRLAVLDLSPAGHQPMVSADDNHVICFNGEIYNFRELRAELEQDNVFFRTGTDTEVLLHLYRRDGVAMVQKLRGMFAFALWDAAARRCVLARDRFGIKPLYYSVAGGTLAFASEVRTLQRSGMVGRRIDATALARFFEMGSVAEPRTLLQDAACLEAGHVLTWEQGRVTTQKYWQLRFDPEPQPVEDAVRLTRAALLDSVQAHFVSDVPVGLFLSGGIDSTAMLALARELGMRNLRTFAIGVDEARLDEAGVAARTAAHFGADHHELRLNADTAGSLFGEFMNHMDQPCIDGFNTFTVAGFARSHDMKVVLSGLGGDELFGGYPSFRQVPRLARASRWLHRLPGASALVGRVLESDASSPRMRRLGGALQLPPTLTNAWRAFRGVFSRREAAILAARYAGDSVADPEACPQLDAPSAHPADHVSACELSLYMRNQLLKDSDIMSMAHGLELRVPLVDHVLFERLARIPAAIRLQPGKQLLLDAVPEIPPWVANQPKRGFLFPYEKWLAGSWSDAFADVNSRMPGRNPSWYQRWCVFMIERWLERL